MSQVWKVLRHAPAPQLLPDTLIQLSKGMIVCAQEPKSELDRDLFWQMYQARAQIFSDHLSRDAPNRDARALDRFDSCNPLYVMCVSDDGRTLLGSIRLLKTLDPNMLRDVFDELLEPGEVVAGPTIWESSRFCVCPNNTASAANRATSRVPSRVIIEPLVGIVDCALSSGIDEVVSVFDAGLFRALNGAGCGPKIVGRSKVIGQVQTYAGVFKTTGALHTHLLRQLPDRTSVHVSGRRDLDFAALGTRTYQ